MFLFKMILVASKKTKTRKWLQPEPHKLQDFIEIIKDIYLF